MCHFTAFPPLPFMSEEVSATFSPSFTYLFKLTIRTPLTNRGREAMTNEVIQVIKKKGGIHYLGGKFVNWLLSVFSHHVHGDE